MSFVYQRTDYDCGTATFLNAVSYLFKRSEIPVEVVKRIVDITTDMPENGNLYKGGTSDFSIEYLVYWLNSYAEECNFDIDLQIIDSGSEARVLISANFENTCFVVKMFDPILQSDHFYLVTGADVIDGVLWMNVFDCHEENADVSIHNDLYNRRLIFDLYRFSDEKWFESGISKPMLVMISRGRHNANERGNE